MKSGKNGCKEFRVKLPTKADSKNVVIVQGTYELAFVLWARFCGLNEVLIVHPEPLLYFDAAGKPRQYFPDFKMGEFYIEIKSDFTARIDAEKLRCIQKMHLVVVMADDYLWEYLGIEKVDQKLIDEKYPKPDKQTGLKLGAEPKEVKRNFYYSKKGKV